MNDEITNTKIYDLLNDIRAEFNGRMDKTDQKIQKVVDDFTFFERGVTTGLVADVATLKGQQQGSGFTVTHIGMAISLLISAATLALVLLKGIK